MEIEITITEDGGEITKSDVLSFESAYEELGKLERRYLIKEKQENLSKEL